MRRHRRILCTISILLVIQIAFTVPAQAISTYVDLTYPNFPWTDKDLPAKPGSDISQYKKELISWGNEVGINISQTMANTAVNLSSPIIFTDENGTERKIQDSSYPVWKTMRDIIFLESMQESIQKWQDTYINSGDAVSPTDAFGRARQICQEYGNYVNDTNKNNNPLQNVIFCTTDETNYTADFFKDFVVSSAKKLPDNILEGNTIFTLSDGISSIVSATKSQIKSYLQNHLPDNQDVNSGFLLYDLASKIPGALKGGLSGAFSVGSMYWSLMSYLNDTIMDIKGGIQFLILYNFSSGAYSESELESLFDPSIWQITNMSFLDFCIVNSGVHSDDVFGNRLATAYAGAQINYNLDFEGGEEYLKTAYTNATLLRSVSGLDIEAAKRSLVNYVALYHDSGLKISRYDNTNSFAVSLNNANINDDSHGGKSKIDWYCGPSKSAYVNMINSTTYPGITSNFIYHNSLIVGMDANIQPFSALSNGGYFKAVITYNDATTKICEMPFEYLPQHSNPQLTSIPTTMVRNTAYEARLTIPGDTYQNVAIMLQKNGSSTITSTTINSITWDFSNQNYIIAFKPIVSAGTYNIWAKVDSTESNKTQVEVTDPGSPGLPNTIYLYPFTNIYGVNISSFYLSNDVYANVVLQGGTLDLNGRTIRIHGNLTQESGTININGGRLEITGNYRIQGLSGTTYTHSSGYLKMTNEADYVKVGGEFVTDSSNNHTNYLTAGILEVKGNFTQISTDWNNWNDTYWEYNFNATGTHKVILSGDGLQTVSFENPNNSGFNYFENPNSNVTFASSIRAWPLTLDEYYYNSTLKLTGTLNIDGGIWPFPGNDMVLNSGGRININCDVLTIPGEYFMLNGTMYSNGHNITITGNINMGGGQIYLGGGFLNLNANYSNSLSVNLEGGTVIAAGSLTQTGGTIYINGGRLEVAGDYKIQSSTGGYSTGNLVMNNNTDYVKVGGEFYIDSENFYKNYFTAGVLEVKGNFTQKATYRNAWYDDYPTYNFDAKGTHKVVLSGDGEQVVSFMDVGASGFNYFENPNSNVTFATSIRAWPLTLDEYYYNGTLTLTGTLNIDEGTWPFPGNDMVSGGRININCDALTIPGEYFKLNGTLYSNGHHITITGNIDPGTGSISLSGGLLNLNADYSNSLSITLDGGTVIAAGSLTQTGGTIYINGGRLEVAGDYKIQSSTGGYCLGTLVMNNSTDYVKVGGEFYIDSVNLNKNYFTAGVLEVKGNFTQKATYRNAWGDLYPTYNFDAKGTHKVVLTGEGEQVVSFMDVGASGFNCFENPNSNVTFATPVRITTLTTDKLNYNGVLQIKGNLAIANSILTITGGGFKLLGTLNITNTTQEIFIENGYDCQIAGGLFLNGNSLIIHEDILESSGGYINLNGGTLKTTGNFLQTDGTVNINGGRLEIDGDYKIQSLSGIYSFGSLQMMKAADYIKVNGNFIMDSSNNHTSCLTAGILEVKGNFTQKSTYTTNNNSTYNFNATGTHKVILSGDTEQIISFEDPFASGFNYFENPNSNVTFATPVRITTLTTDRLNYNGLLEITGNFAIASSSLTLTGGGFKMAATLTITNANQEIFIDNGYDCQIAGNLNLNGNTLTIHDDILESSGGNINLNGGTLKTTGNFLHTYGTVNINGGRLEIAGDYKNQSITGSYSNGILQMMKTSDYIMVGGNFIMDSCGNHTSYLTAGILEVKGNFTQKSTYTSNNNSTYNFDATGTHKVILSGDGTQNISFEDPQYSHFNILEITESSMKHLPITFNSQGGSNVNSITTALNTKIGAPISPTREGYKFAGWYKDANCRNNWNFYTDIVTGEMTLYAKWIRVIANISVINGETSVIDDYNQFIFGLKCGITKTDFESNYVSITGNARLEYSTAPESLGTGSEVYLVNSITNEVLQTFTIVIFGDVNGDGIIDTNDADTIIDIGNYALLQWDNVTGAAFIMAGDLFRDGIIDENDCSVIRDVQNYSLNIDQSTGIVTQG